MSAITPDDQERIDAIEAALLKRWPETKIAPTLERIDYEFGIVACGSGIPKTQSSNSVGVNVFWCALKFCEDRQFVTSIFSLWMICFEQDCAVRLHNQRPKRHP